MDERDNLSELHPAIRGLKTVCRCNNVKYKSLERVIKAGATSIADVAKQTTATTGYCGGSCTPYIQEIIADVLGGPRPEKPKPTETDENGDPPWWVRIE